MWKKPVEGMAEMAFVILGQRHEFTGLGLNSLVEDHG
jgi:hypothetical protein